MKNQFALLLAISLLYSCQTKESQEATIPSNSEIVESYVYLLSRALVVRQEQMDFDGTGLEYNTIKYNEAGKADFVNPNLDVAYMEAWIAVDDKSAVIIEIPEIKDRYYTVQLLDGWGEVIVNLNERNFPDHPFGRFALVLENAQVDIPEDALKVPVYTDKIKMLARVELQDDLEAAVALQKQFQMSVIGTPVIAPTINFPNFTNQAPPQSNLFEYTEVFLQSSDEKMENDSIQTLTREIGHYLADHPESASRIDSVITKEALPKFINYAITEAGKFENGWLATLLAGNYDSNYWTRTAANFVGIWANKSEEVIYFIASKDANGEALGNGKSYSLTFPKESLPGDQVNGFWSVILVDFPNYRVVENELNRFNFNNYSEFTYNPDGSLTLYIAPELQSDWPKSNWLPSPKEGLFNLTLRSYVPKENVLRGDWFPTGLAPLE